MNISLKESWSVSGTDLLSFRDTLKSLDKTSKFYHDVKSEDLQILTFQEEKDDKLVFSYWDTSANSTAYMTVSKRALEEAAPDLIPEFKRGRNLLLYEKVPYFLGGNFITSLGQRLKLAGDNFLKQSQKRDEYITEALSLYPFEGTLMFRSDGKTRKAFAIHSKGYGHVNQEVLADICDMIEMELGEAEVTSWNINHYATNIFIEFPEKADDISSVYGLPNRMVPGVLLETSDTGDASIKAVGTWIIDGRKVPVKYNKHSRKHSGVVDIDNFFENVNKKVFGQYTKLPERLADLLMIPVDPKAAYDHVLDDINFKDVVGSNVNQQVREELEASINPTISYTAYDIAMTIMSLPERLIGLKPNKAEKLAFAVTEAPFVDYNKITKVTLV